MAKRKSRDSGIPKGALLLPFNVLDFGDMTKDPCFGKLYDLNAEECQMCGDIEWCGTVFHQKLQKDRLVEEKQGSRLDLEMANLEDIKVTKEYYQSLLDKGFKSSRALSKTAKRFHKKIEIIRKIIKQ
jgi:hypothetical protein